jgi:uncharacterized membrane protein required for colicin V production
MNTLVLVVLGIILIFTFLGYRAGLIKTVFSICSMIVALVLTLLISPQVSKALQANEDVVGYFSEKVDKALNLDKVADDSISDKTSGIDKLPIPASMKDSLKKNCTEKAYEVLGVSSFTDFVSHSIARMIINALAFVVTFLVLIIVLRILSFTLDLISKLPVLNQINKLAGLTAGLVQGMIVVWLLCIVLTMFSGSALGKTCFEMINESKFLGFIYNNNFILNFVVDIKKALM